jgi:hypothetical protein
MAPPLMARVTGPRQRAGNPALQEEPARRGMAHRSPLFAVGAWDIRIGHKQAGCMVESLAG